MTYKQMLQNERAHRNTIQNMFLIFKGKFIYYFLWFLLNFSRFTPKLLNDPTTRVLSRFIWVIFYRFSEKYTFAKSPWEAGGGICQIKVYWPGLLKIYTETKKWLLKFVYMLTTRPESCLTDYIRCFIIARAIITTTPIILVRKVVAY